MTDARARATEAASTLDTRERALERLTAQLAEWNAQKSGHGRAREVAAALVETTSDQLAEAQARLARALEEAEAAPDTLAADDAAQTAKTAANGARAAADSARAALAGKTAEVETLTRALEGAAAPLEESEREIQRLGAEASALSDLLRPEGQDLWPPLIDAVVVEPGYEAALAVALGDDLQAPLDIAAPQHWRELGIAHDLAPLPGGARPLSEIVEAPARSHPGWR